MDFSVDIITPFDDITLVNTIANSARVSYKQGYADDSTEKPFEDNLRLLKYLYRHKHMSPFEMLDVQFIIEAPLVVWWHIVRHRTFSYNFTSGRYTEYDDNVYVPKEWRNQSTTNKQGSDGVNEASNVFEVLFIDHVKRSQHLYELALKHGIAKEQARFFLPAFCVYHKAIMKGNLRNWLHFLGLRTAQEAQYETRMIANAVADILYTSSPSLKGLIDEYGYQ